MPVYKQIKTVTLPQQKNYGRYDSIVISFNKCCNLLAEAKLQHIFALH